MLSKITHSQILIASGMILILFSIIFPLVLFNMGVVCKSQVDRENLLSAKQLQDGTRYHCKTPFISPKYLLPDNRTINPEFLEVTDAYKDFIENAFSGSGLLVTVLFLITYESLLIGAGVLILTGNPIAPSGLRRLFASTGLFFVVIVMSTLVLVFPLRELTDLAPFYAFLALLWVPAVVGLGIYLWLIYGFQKRTTDLQDIHNVLDSNLSEIFSGSIPVDTQRTQSLGSRALNLAQSKLSSGLYQVFSLDDPIKAGELHLHQVEEHAAQEINKKINETTSIIRENIKSSFDITHMENDQVNQVFRYLLRDEEFKIFNEHLS